MEPGQQDIDSQIGEYHRKKSQDRYKGATHPLSSPLQPEMKIERINGPRES
jgi:hypothetical protein